MTPDQDFEYVGFGKRAIAGLVDSIIGFALLPLVVPLQCFSFNHRTILPQIAYSVVWTALYVWLIVRFGATPGKMVVKARIVDSNGDFLSWPRALLRMLFPGFLIMINSKLRFYQVISAAQPDVSANSFWELGRVMNQYTHPAFRIVGMLLGWAAIIDVLVVIWNKKKRAVHDFIAGSYVVTKDSLANKPFTANQPAPAPRTNKWRIEPSPAREISQGVARWFTWRGLSIVLCVMSGFCLAMACPVLLAAPARARLTLTAFSCAFALTIFIIAQALVDFESWKRDLGILLTSVAGLSACLIALIICASIGRTAPDAADGFSADYVSAVSCTALLAAPGLFLLIITRSKPEQLAPPSPAGPIPRNTLASGASSQRKDRK